MSKTKVVLLTGASSGIGQATASLLARRGFKVFGTSRNPSHDQSDFVLLPLDVGSERSAQMCVQSVMEKVGKIDILINNAGYMLVGAAEETTVAQAQMQMDTNFFGMVRMINQVLGIMRQQQGGQIINISSIGGLISLPFSSVYCASKYAVEGYTEALRYEVAPFNIRVSLVEPGLVRGDDWYRSRRLVEQSYDAYARVQQRFIKQSQVSTQQSPLTCDRVADEILRIVESRSPRLRYRIGSSAKSISLMKTLFPAGIFELMTRKIFQLDN